jgi:hypothetical protein
VPCQPYRISRDQSAEAVVTTGQLLADLTLA